MIRSPLAQSFMASPNIEARAGDRRPDTIVLHYTGMESAAAACAWLCNASSGVSCHYLVDGAGDIVQMVGEEMRAWHAGVSSWRGETDINTRSIGIEIQNPGHASGYPDFPDAQMRAVIALCHDIGERHHIPPRNLVAHSDVAPARKIDPGEKFDWAHLHRDGVGHWVEPAAISDGPVLRLGDRSAAVAALQAQLSGYGYGVSLESEFDITTQNAVNAFQRHFRPARIDGIADRSTVETLERLVAALPD
ncbi:MAG: N-acetylmuramoyl-L-alanine amidase [Rhizobiales bacterium]|nr:N-acetylmuramoyl-L-alanine amidase [Hyphomicrobiales bacterium]